MKYFSICIPTYEMGGYGHIVLQELFEELKVQTFQDFEIVISDQSVDDNIFNLSKQYSSEFTIRYFKNFYNRGKAAHNTNKAMQYASGKVVKILFQDDFFTTETALATIYNKFELENCNWLVNGWTHTNDKKTFYNTKIPHYTDVVILGENSIGNPSNIALLNNNKLYFDENLYYVFDCEYYFRLKHKFGLPAIIEDTLVCSRIHPTASVNNPELISLKDKEVAYSLVKNNIKLV